ncbi:MAG: hypothetical protein ACRYFW_08645 [Janthinobacterium lividum]
MPNFRHLARAAALVISLSGAGLAAQTVLTHVANTATLSFASGPAADAPRTVVPSNTVSLDYARTKMPTTLGFRLLPVGVEPTGFQCLTSPDVTTVGAPIDAATLAAAPPMAVLDPRQPLIMILTDTTANLDPTRRETAMIDASIGAQHQKVRLTETGVDTGVFAGGFPALGDDHPADACDLRLKRGDSLKLSYAEDDDSLGSSSSALVDPAGDVFDSTTGALVNGASVTLLDATGAPARVFGDDGVTAYPATVVSGASVSDASGRTYPGSTGHYRFPFVAPGTYTLRVVPPGRYAAPSKVTPDMLARLPGEGGQPFFINDGSYGRSFTITADRDFLSDIPLDPASDAALMLTKTASVRQASPGDFVQYRLTLTNRGTGAATGVHVADTLPVGLRYRRGSARGVAEPAVSADGRSLDFTAPAVAPSATVEVSYVVSVAPGAPVGEALNRAAASGDGGATSNEASASVRIQPLLFTDALTILGRVTAGPCSLPERERRGVAGIRLLMEDGTFVVTDRDGLYHFEGARPGRHVVQMDAASIPASLAPLACERDTRHAGSATQRFVEGAGGLIQRADFQLIGTGKAATAAAALPVEIADDATAAGHRDWLAGQTPGIDWLFPAVDHNPRAPVLRVVVKHRPGQRVALTINGVRSEPLAFDGSDADAKTGVAVSRWTGIPLVDGDNKLVARVLEEDGREAKVLERTVHVAGAGRRADFVPGVSRLVADGLNRPLIAVRVTDQAGRPVRAGTLVPFSVDQPYVPAIEAELEQRRQLAGRERSGTVARVVGDDGLAFIALQPTTQAGAVHLVVNFTQPSGDDRSLRTSDVRAWLSAAQKSWTVVGFGAGTLGYDTLSHHGQPLGANDARTVADGQLALYAKGRIKGSWLLTIAYDSKHAYDPDRGLLGTIDPDRYYTVYGDGSAQGYDAPTRRKLYLRLERREAYALFGDFESGFTEAQFTRYSRTLNGVKAAYEGEHLRAAGFAAQSSSRYARDEIQGNGLTGPYRLSGRDIVPNSDKLTIEVRDRFRSERIVSSQSLTRHIDYDIDPILGTVRFRSPVLTRDTALNPIFIVAEYEVESGHTDQLAAAARVATRLANGRVQIGAGAIHDEAVGNATIVGLDLKAKPDRATEVRVELARGGPGGLGAGTAALAEIERHRGALDLLGYARRQDAGFGVGQQNVVEAGTRKMGLDGSLRLGGALTLTGTAWYQDQLDGPGSRTAGEVRLNWRRATGTLFVGGQFAADRGLDGGDRTSELLTLGGSRSLADGKIVLAGQTQVAPGGDKASVDFPIRHQITASWRVSPGIRLIGGYEIADGAGYVAHTAQIGFDVAPWTGAKLSSTLDQQAMGENGRRTFAQYGLSQSLPLGRRWTVDATLDASTTLSGRIDGNAAVTPFQPIASGGSLSGVGTGSSASYGGLGSTQTNAPYTTVTLGATYRGALWSWNGRIEHRGGAGEDRWGLTSNMLRALGRGSTLAGSVKAYRIEDATGAVASYATGDLALALRPLGSRWSLLERFQLRHEHADASVTDANVLGVPAVGDDMQTTDRVINNVAIDYRAGARTAGHGLEVSVYYGAKFVRGLFGDDVYQGYVDVIGFDLRQDISPRLDVGVQGSVQHAWSAQAVSFSGGPSIGMSPGGNLWITAGYNVSGYRDRDFEADRYTRAGPYLTARIKFDRDAVASALGDAAHALLGHRR